MTQIALNLTIGMFSGVLIAAVLYFVGSGAYERLHKRFVQESVISINIELGTRDIGTVAHVKLKQHRSIREASFVCHNANAIMGGQWIDASSGVVAGPQLTHQLNDSAQAAVRLAAHNASKALGDLSGSLRLGS